jgi:hypothetical protein
VKCATREIRGLGGVSGGSLVAVDGAYPLRVVWRKRLWRKGTSKAGERSLYEPTDLFVTHMCFYAVDPVLIHNVCGHMAIETIDNWKSRPYLATWFFAPLVRNRVLAVAATQEEEDTCPIAARVVFARKADDAAHQLDQEFWNNTATLHNQQARPVIRSFRDHEFYARKSLLSIWYEGENRRPNTRFGSVIMADNDEGAAMIGYMSDKYAQDKCAGYMMLEAPVSRVINAKDSALVAKRIHSVRITMIRSSVAPDGNPFVLVDPWGDRAKTKTAQGLVPSEKFAPRKDRPGGSRQAEARVGSKLAKWQRQNAAQSFGAQAEVCQKKQRKIYAQRTRVANLSDQRAFVDYYVASQGVHPVPSKGHHFPSRHRYTLVEPETSAAGDAQVAYARGPDQKVYIANKERAARNAEVAQDEGQCLGALAAMRTPPPSNDEIYGGR